LQPQNGEVLEWLKRYAWKAYILLKGITGSNPVLSAKQLRQLATKNGKTLQIQ